MTEVLLMAVTAVRELTLLPGDTAIYKKIHSGQDVTEKSKSRTGPENAGSRRTPKESLAKRE